MSAFTPRHKDICTEFQRQTFEDREAVTIDVKECPVGSRHRAAVPATAAKKAPNLCGARSWSHEENKPVLPMTRTSSRTMIHLATFTLASYSVVSLDLKLRSVFEQLNFESAPHISFKKKIDSFSLFFIVCSKIGSCDTFRDSPLQAQWIHVHHLLQAQALLVYQGAQSRHRKAHDGHLGVPGLKLRHSLLRKKGWVGRVGMENLSLKIVWSDTVP